MNKKHSSFTLLELIITVIIIGILGALVIPMYGNVVEKKRGEACINNMRMIIAAERILYTRTGHFWPEYDVLAYSLQNVPDINSNLNIEITENYFGEASTGNIGYTIGYNTTTERLHVWAERISGSYTGNNIGCWTDPLSSTDYNWFGTWPWLPE